LGRSFAVVLDLDIRILDNRIALIGDNVSQCPGDGCLGIQFMRETNRDKKG
jgi:hypothetical protein